MTTHEFATPLHALRNKLSNVKQASPQGMAQQEARDKKIVDAHIRWKTRGDGYQSLKIPNGMVLSEEEKELAGWVLEYAKTHNLTFKQAIADIFEHLKRNPKALDRYTGSSSSVSYSESLGELRFAESPEGKGWDLGRKAKIYQVFHEATPVEAVQICRNL